MLRGTVCLFALASSGMRLGILSGRDVPKHSGFSVNSINMVQICKYTEVSLVCHSVQRNRPESPQQQEEPQ